MKHKQKVKKARKMRTQKEIRDRVPVFLTKAWEERKDAKRRKVEKQMANKNQ